MSNYLELFKDPRWQKKRLEVLELNNWECENCGNKKKTLSIHHKHYKKGTMPWEYENFELICLCYVCHNEYHGILDYFKSVGLILNIGYLYRLLGYCNCLERESCLDIGINLKSDDIKPLNYEYAQGIADYFHKDVNTIINQKNK